MNFAGRDFGLSDTYLHHIRQVRLRLATDLAHKHGVSLVQLKLQQPASNLRSGFVSRRGGEKAIDIRYTNKAVNSQEKGTSE